MSISKRKVYNNYLFLSGPFLKLLLRLETGQVLLKSHALKIELYNRRDDIIMSVCGAARCRWIQTRGAAVSLRVLQQNRTVCTTGAPESIREKLQAFPGGSIDLQKRQESGIAVLTVNNPARMNAFSGNLLVFTPHIYGQFSLRTVYAGNGTFGIK